MEITNELLVAVLARIVKLEATMQTFAVLALQTIPKTNPELEVIFNLFVETRARHMDNQIDSLSVQFPQYEKFFRDHVLVAESDLKGFLKEAGKNLPDEK